MEGWKVIGKIGKDGTIEQKAVPPKGCMAKFYDTATIFVPAFFLGMGMMGIIILVFFGD